MGLEKALFGIFHFQLKDSPDAGLLVEDCGNFTPQLNGYCITLPDYKRASLELFLCKEFESHAVEISDAFASQDDAQITQCIKVYYPDVGDSTNSLTEQFVAAYGSIDSLIKFGPSGNLVAAQNYNKSADVPDEEQPLAEIEEEVLDEMDIKLKQENEELKQQLAKQQELLDSLTKEKEYQDKFYPGYDLGNEREETFEYIMTASGEEMRTLNREIALHIIEAKDPRQIDRFVKTFVDARNRMRSGGGHVG